MLPALLSIVAFLVIGHALLGAFCLAFLNVPESNVLMLALSAILTMLVLVGAAWVETFAWLSWTATGPRLERARRSLQAVPAFLAALALFAGVYWLTGRAGTWFAAHRGEIDAWLIVHLRAVKTGGLHASLGWLVWFVRYPLGLSLALGLLAQLLGGGGPGNDWPPPLSRQSRHRRSVLFSAGHWLRISLNPLRLALITLCLLAFIWLPWQAVNWRPKSLPPTWLEPAFVAVKLALLYLLANVGWALVLRTAHGSVSGTARTRS